jgi:hypothetical protein
MKTKVTLDAESINSRLKCHNVDYTVYNGNYVYINFVNNERQLWLEPLVNLYRMDSYDVIRIYYNAYDKHLHIKGERTGQVKSSSSNKVYLGAITYAPLIEFIEDLKKVKVNTETFY